jgi:hypothetical protein
MASKWEPHRATIEKLYIDEKRTLQQVMSIMEKDVGFSAR